VSEIGSESAYRKSGNRSFREQENRDLESLEISTKDLDRSWEQTRVTRLPTSGTRAPEVGRGSHSTSQAAKRREDRDRPSEEDRWQRSRRSCELGSSQVEGPSVGCPKSRVAKWREDCSHPSVEVRWQRSRDLANSGVRRLKSQVLGIPSHEWRIGEKIGAVHL
jgi:hypothetical protein